MTGSEKIRFYPRFVLFHKPATLERVTEGQCRVYIQAGHEVAWETLDPNGAVMRTDGVIPDGTVREFYESGELKAELEYRNSRLNGTVREYMRNGDLGAQTEYAEGRMQGVRKVFSHTGDGVMLEIATYAADRLNGPRSVTFDNGKLWCEENYADGLLDGEKKLFFKNGQCKVVEHYRKGRLEGERLAYHDNGRVQCEEKYRDGRVLSRKMYMRSGVPIESAISQDNVNI